MGVYDETEDALKVHITDSIVKHKIEYLANVVKNE